MLILVVLIPALAGAAAFAMRSDRLRRVWLVSAAVLHAAAVLWTWHVPPGGMLGGWLDLDAPGRLFLSISSLIFLASALYSVDYLRREEHARKTSSSEAVFTGCLLLFLASMSLIAVSAHFGLIWVAVEASTLASAPLIYYHRNSRSLEATWKYLVVCSVGVALALLGNFFLAVAASTENARLPLFVGELSAANVHLQVPWVRAAFLFFLVGYGTKMGLAPFHNWLPDAHSESPSLVSALLSGALLNCAFLGILRGYQVCLAVGAGPFAQDLLVLFGLLSVALAAMFIVGQADYKRMLAYSSVEHVGILALGVGLGGAATYGAMLHSVNHSFTKAMLFLVAGNVLVAYRTKSSRDITGMAKVLPFSSVLWLAGVLAITGSPPFGVFMSEFMIFRAAVHGGHVAVAVAYLAFLGIIFVGMSSIVLKMVQGESVGRLEARESVLSVLPSAVLGVIVLLLGVYIPQPLHEMLAEASRMLGGQ